MTIQRNVLVLMLAVLVYPSTAQTETTSELINRLAEEGRKQSWVLPTDCQVEQAAVRRFRFEGASYGCDDRTGNDTEQSISAALERPWVYRWGGKVDASGLMTASELRQNADQAITYAEKEESQDRRVYSGAHCSATIHRLTACAYRVAATRRDGTAAESPAADKTKSGSQCELNEVANANKEIQEIDRSLTVFLQSPVGQQSGMATPSLQVVMWGISEQTKVMRRYCPNADAFREKIDDLMSSFHAAQKACRQIQSNPEVCMPAAPHGLIASYEQAQSEAATADRGTPATSSAKTVAPTSSSLCPADLPIADFMGCLKARCLERGFSPVETQGGCLICGNPEGDLGGGFQWRQCHKSSTGVGAAR